MIQKESSIRKIIETALLIRRVEERIASEYSSQKMRCPVHLSIGQEFTSAIFSAAFKSGDTAVSTHRAHAHYLAMGGNLNRMIAEIYGKATGCSRGRGGSMHLIDLEAGFLGSSAIVGNSVPVGVGVALSHKLDNNDAVCLCLWCMASVINVSWCVKHPCFLGNLKRKRVERCDGDR